MRTAGRHMGLSTLRALYEQAVDLPVSARARFLDTHCPDRDLRERLERMLDAAPGPEGALPPADAPTLAERLQDQDAAPALPAGTVIGSFTLIDVVGEGGSSTVFRAARHCDGVPQFVALKLLRRAVYTQDARRQFRGERL